MRRHPTTIVAGKTRQNFPTNEFDQGFGVLAHTINASTLIPSQHTNNQSALNKFGKFQERAIRSANSSFQTHAVMQPHSLRSSPLVPCMCSHLGNRLSAPASAGVQSGIKGRGDARAKPGCAVRDLTRVINRDRLSNGCTRLGGNVDILQFIKF